jgi:hypothetical protein
MVTCFHRPVVTIHLWTSGPVCNESDREVFLAGCLECLSDAKHLTSQSDSRFNIPNDLLLQFSLFGSKGRSRCVQEWSFPLDYVRVHGTVMRTLLDTECRILSHFRPATHPCNQFSTAPATFFSACVLSDLANSLEQNLPCLRTQ